MLATRHLSLDFVFTAEGEVCGIKRKSEVGLESSEDAAVETTESKKQKVEETAEPEVASNGVC